MLDSVFVAAAVTGRSIGEGLGLVQGGRLSYIFEYLGMSRTLKLANRIRKELPHFGRHLLESWKMLVVRKNIGKDEGFKALLWVTGC